jgi:hypothetical protein
VLTLITDIRINIKQDSILVQKIADPSLPKNSILQSLKKHPERRTIYKKNKDRWEKIQHNEISDADEMAKEFTRLVDDLGYAKTFYPTSRVTKYVNALASRIYLTIIKTGRKNRTALLLFGHMMCHLQCGNIIKLFFLLAFYCAFCECWFFFCKTR